MIPIFDDNPTIIRPYVTYGLIGACIAAYAYQISIGIDANDDLINQYGVVPAKLVNLDPRGVPEFERFISLVSSAFLHGGPYHLVSNMLFLWIFGNNVEDAMGHLRFFLFYLLTGAAAMLAQALPELDSGIPIIGASGAISGVLGAYLLLYPAARVTLLFWFIVFVRLIKLPAAIVLIFWFLIQLISTAMAGASEQSTIAFDAHIGGFLAGMVLVTVFKARDFVLHNPLIAIVGSKTFERLSNRSNDN